MFICGCYLNLPHKELEVRITPTVDARQRLRAEDALHDREFCVHARLGQLKLIRRYARAIRNTPDEVAARLHWLALVVGDLAGGYNEIGIRQWFTRKRTQLDGRTPEQLLTGQWKPDDPGPRRVRSLAHSLTGSPVT